MLPIRKIVVPVNFTESCHAAAKFAINLGVSCDAELYLVHVLEPFASPIGFESAALFEDGFRARRRHVCRELEDFIHPPPNAKLQRALLDGDPATEIVRFTHNERADLVVMPTRGYGAFRRLLMGSVTAKVLHDADCPVWTGVQPLAFAPDGQILVRSVACAIDLGPQSRSVLRWASGFAALWNAPLTIIHILRAMPDEKWTEQFSSMARDQITQYQHELGIEATLQLGAGQAPGTVSEFVRKLAPDLLVIGRGQLGATGRLGGSAYAIVRDALCAVVSV